MSRKNRALLVRDAGAVDRPANGPSPVTYSNDRAKEWTITIFQTAQKIKRLT